MYDQSFEMELSFEHFKIPQHNLLAHEMQKNCFQQARQQLTATQPAPIQLTSSTQPRKDSTFKYLDRLVFACENGDEDTIRPLLWHYASPFSIAERIT